MREIQEIMSTWPVPSPDPPDPEESAWQAMQVPTAPIALDASVEQYGLVGSAVQLPSVHYDEK